MDSPDRQVPAAAALLGHGIGTGQGNDNSASFTVVEHFRRDIEKRSRNQGSCRRLVSRRSPVIHHAR
jgi:hypothetical protein